MNGKVPGDGFKCWSMKPNGDFNYAINTEAETLTLNIDEEKLANGYPFDLDGTPISVSLPVRPITWELEKDRYNPVLPASEYVVVKGTERNINLVPYGAAKLRVTVFPDAMRKNHKTLTDSLLINPDFEQTSAATVNHGGIEKKTYKPYGWNVRGTLNGSSYGINHDAANNYGENVCWYRTIPFPLDFQLYQTVPASKLKPGAYRVRCLLWCQTGAFGTCGLFANNHVQYFGKESDYGENLPSGVVATFAGHKGTSGSTFIMQEMEVTVSIEEGESLTLGICTSGMKPDGTQASGSDATGWFKVDHFRIERVKDVMTFNVVKVTYEAHCDMIPTLKEEEKEQILAWLIEARELAIDAESSKKKHEVFGKYKGRINNYLAKRGYDLVKEREAWYERIKARGGKI